MTSEIAISAKGLGKAFRYYDNKWQRIGSAFFHRGNHSQNLWALRNVNLELTCGTTLGIIGQNGSGKTTLLQLLAGLLKPTEGEVELRGSLATLLELQSGFQLDLTGRENIFISCGLRGFSRKDIQKRVNDIIEFAEISEFIDHPIRHYSSGMLLRLAFATAINVRPDILLIDEVFSVGDMAFQHKCARKFRELQSRKTTIVLATHDMSAVKSLCDRALLLDRGKPVELGPPEDVTNFYLSLIAEQLTNEQSTLPTYIEQNLRSFRHGTAEGKITKVEILCSSNELQFGEETTFRFHIEYFADVQESILGFIIRDRYGNDLIGINTYEEQQPIGPMKNGDRMVIDFSLPLYLREGTYSVSPGLSYHPTEPRYLDWIDHAAVFRMAPPKSGQRIHGFFWLPNKIQIKKAEKS